MKLKYYMRGLGIGIILTTLILSISNGKEKLSNDEIIKRATNLGMVMEEELNNNLEKVLEGKKPTTAPDPTEKLEPTTVPEPTENLEPTTIPEPTENLEPTITPEPIEALEPTTVPEPTENLEPTTTPEPTEALEPTTAPEPTDNNKEITFSIVSGMSSGKVAELLHQKGLVDNAAEYNEYIIKAGKASVIRVGTYAVTKGASFKEITEMITSN